MTEVSGHIARHHHPCPLHTPGERLGIQGFSSLLCTSVKPKDYRRNGYFGSFGDVPHSHISYGVASRNDRNVCLDSSPRDSTPEGCSKGEQTKKRGDERHPR